MRPASIGMGPPQRGHFSSIGSLTLATISSPVVRRELVNRRMASAQVQRRVVRQSPADGQLVQRLLAQHRARPAVVQSGEVANATN